MAVRRFTRRDFLRVGTVSVPGLLEACLGQSTATPSGGILTVGAPVEVTIIDMLQT